MLRQKTAVRPKPDGSGNGGGGVVIIGAAFCLGGIVHAEKVHTRKLHNMQKYARIHTEDDTRQMFEYCTRAIRTKIQVQVH